MRCPSCHHDHRPDRRFCTQCGAALAAVCPACGAPTEPGENFCGACGARLEGPSPEVHVSAVPELRAPSAEPRAEAERRQLTVLFCDVVGSTALSQQLDAEEWRDLVTRYHQAASAAIARFGGHVAKYLGDGVLALFGHPQAHEDDAERAGRAGLAIIGAVEDGLSVRIGLHTGATVVGHGAGDASTSSATPPTSPRACRRWRRPTRCG